MDASCYDTLGLMSVDNYDGTCSCSRWYSMTPKLFWGGYECTSKTTYCYDKYWYNSSYDSLSDSCTCGYWSVWGTDMFWNASCVSWNTACRDEYWFSSSYDSLSDKCKCNYWYVFSTDMFWNTSCVSWDAACHDQLWYNSSYESLTKSCVCDDWYTIRDGECQKKAYTTYWVLKELKDDTAIVVFKKPNSFSESYYEIDFSVWCRDVEDYVWEVIVLNLMYDERFNYWDYLVLPESKDYDWDSQHCKITSTNEVNDNDSLYDIPTNNYININNYTNTISYPQNNEEIEKAIKWMYSNWLTIYNEVETFMGNEYLTRQQASKFFVEFAEKIIWSPIDIEQEVSFGDLAKADKTLKSHIIKAAQLWLFKWVKGSFLPFNNLTRAQALAVIVRMIDWEQYEPSPDWYISYYTTAFLTYDILGGLNFDFDTVDSINITRGEVALLLYRLITNNIIK